MVAWGSLVFIEEHITEQTVSSLICKYDTMSMPLEGRREGHFPLSSYRGFAHVIMRFFYVWIILKIFEGRKQ